MRAAWGVLAVVCLVPPLEVSARADPPAPAPGAVLSPLALGQVVRIGAVAGTGTATRDYGIGATDLCDFLEFPVGILQVCGDSFAGQGVGFGGYYAPIALHVSTDSLAEPTGARYGGVVGVDEPLLADPTPTGASQLPAGVIAVNRQNYLMVTTTKELVPMTSRLVTTDPARGSWATVPGSVRPATHAGGRQSQVSGYYDPIPTAESASGWVYVVANDFDRSAPVQLYRVPPALVTDRSKWQGWSAAAGWNSPPTPLWSDQVGELSMRQIDGKTVLSYFNGSTGNMEVRVADDPTGLGSAPVTTVVVAGDWPADADDLPAATDNRLAQPYGGYVSPGSTLDELRIFVSQWDTDPRADRAPYRVVQFAVNPYKPGHD